MAESGDPQFVLVPDLPIHGLHGLDFARRGRRFFLRKSHILYFGLFLFGAFGFFVHTMMLVASYHKFSTVFDSEIVSESVGGISFPAITICSLNPFKMSKIDQHEEINNIQSAYNYAVQKVNLERESSSSNATVDSNSTESTTPATVRKKREPVKEYPQARSVQPNGPVTTGTAGKEVTSGPRNAALPAQTPQQGRERTRKKRGVGCPPLFTTVNTQVQSSSCYHLSEELFSNYDDVHAYCQSVGAHMPVYRNEDEEWDIYALVFYLLYPSTGWDRALIGLADRNNTHQYKWDDGSPINYTHFDPASTFNTTSTSDDCFTHINQAFWKPAPCEGYQPTKAICIILPTPFCESPTDFVLPGSPNATWAPINGSIEITCDPPSLLYGESILHCNELGEWIEETPICDNTCPFYNQTIPFGTASVATSTVIFGSSVTFTCTDASLYYMIGPATITCQDDATFDLEAPRCDYKCTSPTSFAPGLGSANDTWAPAGGAIEITCDPGYGLFGESVLHCDAMGNWVEDAPICDDKCKFEEFEFPFGFADTEQAIFTFGDTVAYKCVSDSLFEMEGANETTCLPDTSWSNPPPICKELVFIKKLPKYFDIKDMTPGQRRTWDKATEKYDLDTTTSAGSIASQAMVASGKATKNTPLEELLKIAPETTELLPSCDFDSERCDLSNMRPVKHDTYGVCYTFNAEGTRSTSRPGIDNGLSVKILSDQRDLMFTSDMVGAKVTIHDPEDYPFPEMSGFSVAKGFQYIVGFQKEVVNRRPETCKDNNSPFDTIYPANYSYTHEQCIRTCISRHILGDCSCLDSRYPTPPGTANTTLDCMKNDTCYRASIDAADKACLHNCKLPCRNSLLLMKVFPAVAYHEVITERLVIAGGDLYSQICNAMSIWISASWLGIMELILLLFDKTCGHKILWKIFDLKN